MEDLKATEIEQLRQIISRTDKSGNEKLFLLMDFIYTREADLRIAKVNKRRELLIAYNKFCYKEEWSMVDDQIIPEIDEFLSQ